MYAGQIVESGSVSEIFERPGHPYTRALLDAIAYGEPGTRGRLNAIEGQPPDLAELPPACRFAPRCPLADERCRTQAPPQIDPRPRARCPLLESRNARMSALLELRDLRKTFHLSDAAAGAARTSSTRSTAST